VPADEAGREILGETLASEDRILFVNTFSKNWAMTGCWIMTHPALGQVVENLIQYSTSGVAQFMQRASVTALERGEAFVQHQIARARQGRAIVCDRLASTGRCRFAWPQGAPRIGSAPAEVRTSGAIGKKRLVPVKPKACCRLPLSPLLRSLPPWGHFLHF
jgi:hypothetical protein